MTNSVRPSLLSRCNFAGARRRSTAIDAFRVYALIIVYVGVHSALACSTARQSSGGTGSAADTRGISVVNAPAAGEVRRVLVNEGGVVGEGAPVVEIAVRMEATGAPPAGTADPQALARRNIGAAQSEAEAARAEVVRTEVEVQRLTPLVASGEAAPGQLDGARAEYERAQQRLQRAQGAAQEAQANLVAARQQSQHSASPSAPAPSSEQIVVARTAAAGTVTVINARVGERVMAGQSLATVRADVR